MSEDVIAVRWQSVGDAQVLGAFDKVTAASMKADASVKQMDTGFSNLNVGASKAARAIGVFSMAAGSAAPELTKLGSAAMRTAETVTSFGTYLGGPWGIAVGVAVAGVSLFSQALASNKKAAEEAATAQMKFAQAAVEAEAERAKRQASDPYLKALADRAAAESDTSQQEAYEKANEANIFDRIGANGKGKPRADSEFAAMQRRDAMRSQLRGLSDLEGEPSRADALQAQLDAPERAAEATRKKLDAQFEVERTHQQRLVELRTDTDAQFQKIDEAAAQRAETNRHLASTAFTSVATVGVGALQKLAKGQKTSMKEFIGGIGDLLVAQGTADLARAGAMLFIPGLQGNAGGLASAAAIEISTGIGMGAVGASGGGGGGRSRAPHAARGQSGEDYMDSTRARASSPGTAYRGYGGSYGSGQTNVTNIYTPAIIAPTADHGVLITQALREKDRAGL